MSDELKAQIEFNSKKRVTMLKERSARCVCKYCGGQLRVRQIIFTEYEEARIELFCKDCDRIEFGVEPEIYTNAQYFVEETGFNCYPDLDDNEKTKQMTIAKVCEIMAWENKSLGILSREGFTMPLDVNTAIVGECVILTDDDLAEMEELTLETL